MIRFRIPAKPGTGKRACGLSFFNEGGSVAKAFATYEQQIEKLGGDGLLVEDAAYAEQQLRDIGYFALVNGYKRLLRDPSTGKYGAGASFSDLVALYEFDSSLRDLFSHSLTYVERKMRSAVSYSFCDKHGEAQSAYLDPANYSGSRKHAGGIAKLVRMLDALANRNTDHDYIVHYRTSHGNVPLWVLVNATTFGQMSKMYSFLAPSEKAAVSRQFAHANEKELEQFLKVLVLFRNVCAHGERLLAHRTHSVIPDTNLHRKLGIGKKGDQYAQGKSDLFAVVIALRHLLPKDRFLAFKKGLAKLIDGYLKKSRAIGRDALLASMGFPQNWERITRFKL